jgi:ArsR family transcriptional regulator
VRRRAQLSPDPALTNVIGERYRQKAMALVELPQLPALGDPPEDARLAQLAKALGHPTRVHILRLLHQHGACVTGDLVAELPLAQSTVSEHLRILKQAGLVQGIIEGDRPCYCLNPEAFQALVAGIAAL